MPIDIPSFEDRMARLVKRVRAGNVIPFLGAGVSGNATLENHGSAVDFKPTVSHMKQKLLDKVDKSGNAMLQRLVCESDHSSLGWLSELVGLVWSHKEVCELVGIKHFAKLTPKLAHRYVAYLAREGFFREVITTNYDCCLEEAYKQTSGAEYDSNFLHVVRGISDRAHVHSVGLEGPPILHLYKINGCAEVHPPDEVEYIVLTERQMHNFASNSWARVLLQDRLTSHSFLFCGFGSEEPQVRHTVLSIVKEFAAARPKTMCPKEAAELPYAPFIAVYKTPSLPQLQIMATFFEGHTGRGTGDPDCRMAPWFQNMFLGADRREKTLSADWFFETLYRRVMHAEIESRFRRVATDLFEHEGWEPWLEALLGEAEQEERLLRNTKNGLVVQSLLWLIYHPHQRNSDGRRGWYKPLREETELIFLCFWILQCLQKSGKAKIARRSGSVFQAFESDSLRVYLVAGSTFCGVPSRASKTRSNPDSKSSVYIALPKKPQKTVRLPPNCAIVSGRELISKAQSPEQFLELVKSTIVPALQDQSRSRPPTTLRSLNVSAS